LVGSVNETVTRGDTVRRGDELGYFGESINSLVQLESREGGIDAKKEKKRMEVRRVSSYSLRGSSSGIVI
jgi:hypothetical protein